MDAVTTEDLLYLFITFFVAVGLTLAVVVWGREAWKREAPARSSHGHLRVALRSGDVSRLEE